MTNRTGKSAKRLQVRKASYQRTVASLKGKLPEGAMKEPGSLNPHKSFSIKV